jgi:uncharacterized membrane-anchored protein YhcB (DUF1043 family)
MKNHPYFKFIVFLIIGICIGFLIPNIGFFKNGKIKQLEKENEKLHAEIDKKLLHIQQLDSAFNGLIRKENSLLDEIDKRDLQITALEKSIDSVSVLISQSDSNVTKIKQEYEEINNVNSWNINQRIDFFSDYFKTNRP